MSQSAPASTRELRASERRILDAMRQMGFGRYEFLPIRDGELVLDPWPTTVRDVKFGAERHQPRTTAEKFELKQQVSELFEYIRGVKSGEIRMLEVRHGLPFAMEIKLNGSSCDNPGDEKHG